MSWVSLASLTPDRLPATTRLPADLLAARARRTLVEVSASNGGISRGGDRGASLGAARAGALWTWAAPTLGPAPRGAASDQRLAAAPRAGAGATPMAKPRTVEQPAPLSVPETVVRAMREAARAAGRTESEVWAEAARSWLREQRRDDGPQPPTPAAAALAVPRRARNWSTIDAVLADLRQPQRIPSPGEPAA